MSIRFTPAKKVAPHPVSRAFVSRQRRAAANDNPVQALGGPEAEVLAAALYHFAAFGLGAAREARQRAEAAFFAGDRPTYDRWLAICRLLDARVAKKLRRRTEPAQNCQ